MPTPSPSASPGGNGGGSGSVGDIEDYGSVEVTDRCCGASTCRVLAPRCVPSEAEAEAESSLPLSPVLVMLRLVVQ